MTGQKKAVLVFTVFLLIGWLFANHSRISEGPDAVIRMVLGGVFFVLILFRRMWLEQIEDDTESAELSKEVVEPYSNSPVVPVFAIAGVILAVTGIVFTIHQAEWIGLLLILYACLRWSLPPRYAGDALLSLFLLYWVHPLPSQIFGPFQIAMQKLSVHGAEWVMHVLNVRVWADEMMLYTGFRIFGVPEACSGMKTAVTVLLCAMGVGTLLNFRFYKLIILLIAGLVQVLFLNIVRISFMVMMAPKMPDEWADNFLHDSTGIFLLAAIFIINAEAALWATITKWSARAGAKAVQDEDIGALVLGPRIRRLIFVAKLSPFILLLGAFIGGLAYKSRPYHRAMMIHSVIEQLILRNPEHAEKASLTAVKVNPGNITLINQKIKILLVREKFEEAMAELKSISPAQREVLHKILEAWVLVGLERPDEAIALIDALPPHTRNLPGVAMVRAEFGATRDDTKGVVENIVKAADSAWMIRRVRKLFSYLAARHQWHTIVDCDVRSVPYENVTDVLILLHAYLKTDSLWSMESILEYGIKAWPDDPRFMEYMLSMAMVRPGSSWETIFSEKLKKQLDTFTANELAVYIESVFRMNRPDLAWMLYNRLKEIDPNDPTLHLCVAQFGSQWFTFRKHYVGMRSMGRYDTINLKQYYFNRLEWPPAALIDEVPDGNIAGKMREYLVKSVDELKRRAKSGLLSMRTQEIYPRALEKTGEHKKAEEELWMFKKASTRDLEKMRLLNAIDNNIQVEKPIEAWKLLQLAMQKWPDEYRFIGRLGMLAKDNPGSGFEKLFEKKLKTELKKLNADLLSMYTESAFQMNRPDLAWLAYNQLKVIDENDPSLFFMPVLYNYEWFLFRNELAGIPSKSKSETIHLRTLYLRSKDWDNAPMAEQLATQPDGTGYYRHLENCLKELQRREKERTLSIRMKMMFPTTLGLMGRYDEAHQRLNQIVKKFPDQEAEVTYRHALFYHREGKWQETYEAARSYSQIRSQPRLKLELMKVDSLMRMGMGSYAIYMADRAAEVFRGTPEIYEAKAAIWAMYSAPDQAFFEIQHVDNYLELPISARLLWATERYEEARSAGSIYGHDIPLETPEAQSVLLMRAETSVSPQWDPLPGKDEMLKESSKLTMEAANSFSPFAKGLARLRADWFARQGKGESSDPGRWAGVGRDKFEQGTALTELVMLLGRQQRYKEAIDVAEQALVLLPDSVPLRRAMIGLSKGNSNVVKEAYKACPADPEIWLAYLVTRFEEDGPGEWVEEEFDSALKENRFSAEAIVRAGDLARRKLMFSEALKCAKHAIKNGRGLLPAYVLGLRSSLMAGDKQWASLCARQAAQSARDPWPFIRLVAEIETGGKNLHKDAEDIVKKLHDKFPSETKWAIRLSDIYLLKGEVKNALNIIESVIANNPEIDVRALLLAAEASRRSKNLDRAIEILEKAYAMHPANRVVLNNFIYTLSFDKKTLPRAIGLLPKLFDLWGDSYIAYDTAAMVYRNADNKEKALEYLNKAKNAVKNVDSVWLERNPTVVDIDAYMGDYDYKLDMSFGNIDQDIRELSRKDLFSRRELYSSGAELNKKIKDAAKE